jgi:hypothetical protein
MDAVMDELAATGGSDAAALAKFMAEFEAQQRRDAFAAALAELEASDAALQDALKARDAERTFAMAKRKQAAMAAKAALKLDERDVLSQPSCATALTEESLPVDAPPEPCGALRRAAAPPDARAGPSQVDEDDEEEEDDAEYQPSDDEGELQHRSKRPRSYHGANGPLHDERLAASRAAGSARLPTSLLRVDRSTRNVLVSHDASRSTSASGRSTALATTKLVRGEVCELCAASGDALLLNVSHARRVKTSGVAPERGAYNLMRLRELLILHAFDVRGNFLYHRHCLCIMLHVSEKYVTTAHNSAIVWHRAPTITRKKSHVVASKLLRESVVVPSDFTSKTDYLASLGDGEHVTSPSRARRTCTACAASAATTTSSRSASTSSSGSSRTARPPGARRTARAAATARSTT